MKHSLQDDGVLGVSQGALVLDRRQALRQVSIRMVEQARREVLLFERRLAPDIHDQLPFVNALRGLALARAELPIRILVFDPREACRGGPRLIELARRLNSRIALRRTHEDDQDRPDAFMIVDERGYLQRRLATALESVADFDNPGEARRLRAEFIRMWERGSADPELHRLHL